MPRAGIRSEEAHRRTVEADIGSIAGFLEETLGRKLVAFMTGVSDPKVVGAWAQGENKPRSDRELRLRAAYQVFQLLLEHDSHHVVRAWFIGLNPQLDDESPAKVISEDRLGEVLVAAKTYLAGG